ncbi:hypothetical protein C8Q77DRAFT_276909 [Trametes polyzona]|nr:hypothetical protein C8Q77DRAFT_276909 [Trametes polyzona]
MYHLTLIVEPESRLSGSMLARPMWIEVDRTRSAHRSPRACRAAPRLPNEVLSLPSIV